MCIRDRTYTVNYWNALDRLRVRMNIILFSIWSNANVSGYWSEASDGGLVGRTRGRRRDELATSAAAEREGAKQRIVERHDVPGRTVDRLVARRRLGRRGRPHAVEVAQRRVDVCSVDVIRQSALGLEVGWRHDGLMTGTWLGRHVITHVRLRTTSIQASDGRLLLLTIPAPPILTR